MSVINPTDEQVVIKNNYCDKNRIKLVSHQYYFY